MDPNDFFETIEKVHAKAYLPFLTTSEELKESLINKKYYDYTLYEYGNFPFCLLYKYLYFKKVKSKKLSRKCIKESENMWEKFVNCFNGY